MIVRMTGYKTKIELSCSRHSNSDLHKDAQEWTSLYRQLQGSQVSQGLSFSFPSIIVTKIHDSITDQIYPKWAV